MATSLPVRSRWHILFGLLAVAAVALGIGFRLWNIVHEPLWLDEAYSAYAASKGFDFLWGIVPQYETHPPFYYSLLKVWTLIFGDSLAALRALGALCGIGAIGAGVLAAREIGRMIDLAPAKCAVLMSAAAILLALGTLPIEMTREVRPYPLMALVYATIIGLLFRTARGISNGGRLWCRSYAAYLVLLALMLWLHNLGILYAGAAGLALLILCLRRNWTRQDWLALILGHLLVLAVWLPALMILSEQAPTWVQSTWLRFSLSWTLPWTVTRLYVTPQLTSLTSALLLIILAWTGLSGRSQGMRTASALSILMLLPVLLSIAISALIAPVFIPRTLAAVAIPGMLLLALGVAAPRTVAMRILAMIALAVILIEMIALDIHQRRIRPSEDWYPVLAWLEPRFRRGDLVVAYPNEGALAFRFAQRDRNMSMATKPIPTDMPALNAGPGAWNPTGSRGVVSLSKGRLEQIADTPDLQRPPTIWLLRQGAWAYDKGDNFLHALERDRVRTDRIFIMPIEIIGLRRKDLPPVASAQQAKP
jgi:mannosyltransferase